MIRSAFLISSLHHFSRPPAAMIACTFAGRSPTFSVQVSPPFPSCTSIRPCLTFQISVQSVILVKVFIDFLLGAGGGDTSDLSVCSGSMTVAVCSSELAEKALLSLSTSFGDSNATRALFMPVSGLDTQCFNHAELEWRCEAREITPGERHTISCKDVAQTASYNQGNLVCKYCSCSLLSTCGQCQRTILKCPGERCDALAAGSHLECVY